MRRARKAVERLLEEPRKEQSVATGSARPPTKAELFQTIARHKNLKPAEVGRVFKSLNAVIRKSLRTRGSFVLPGIFRLDVERLPALKAREGINPFTGERAILRVKPASKKVRVTLAKALVDEVVKSKK